VENVVTVGDDGRILRQFFTVPDGVSEGTVHGEPTEGVSYSEARDERLDALQAPVIVFDDLFDVGLGRRSAILFTEEHPADVVPRSLVG
jgi:hypothetical protein